MTVSKQKLVCIATGTFLMMFCHGIVNNSTAYFILPVTEFLGCTKTKFSAFYTILSTATAFVSALSATILPHLRLRQKLFSSCIAVTGGYLILSQTNGLWSIYIAAAVIGIFQAFWVVPVVQIINGWFKGRSGFVTGITMSATGFGGLFMGAIMPSVVKWYGWRSGYRLCAAMCFFLSFAVCFLIEEPITEHQNFTKQKGNGKRTEEYKRLLKTSLFWLLMLTALVQGGVGMISQHFNALMEMRGFGVSLISVVMGGMSLLLSLFKIAEGLFSKHIRIELLAPFVTFSGCVGYFALLSPTVPALGVGVLGYACSSAGCTVLYPLILRNLYGDELAAKAWGVCWAAFMVGHGMWTLFYARVLDITGSYNWGLVISAILVALCAAALIWMQRNKRVRENI